MISIKWVLCFLKGLIFFGLITASCSYEPPEKIRPEIITGSADFNKYISIGGSWSTGFMDGSLYTFGQENSFPSILAGQLAQAGGEEFSQPDIHSENGYNPFASDAQNIRGKYVYKFLTPDSPQPVVESTEGEIPTSYTGELTELNNFAVPGLKSFQIDHPQLLQNIYYDRFASAIGQSNLLNDALSASPTFFSIWLGYEDILSYALGGGAGNPYPPSNPDQINVGDLTPQSIFREALDFAFEKLIVENGIRGVVANIPLVSDFFYFNMMPAHVLRINEYQYDAIYNIYKEFNNAVQIHNTGVSESERRPYIEFIGGYEYSPPQPLVIEDKDLPDANYPNGEPLPKIRIITPDEKVLMNFPLENVALFGFGSTDPVPDKYVLTELEISNIEERTNAFNTIVHNIATSYPDHLAVVDISTFFNLWVQTKKYDEFGVPLTNFKVLVDGVPLTFDSEINTGFFSVDGLNPNARGSAFIANKCIEAINQTFGSNIPSVDINLFPGNRYVIGY